MRLWYLSHRRPAKVQTSLPMCAVLPQPSLFAHMKHGSRRRVRQKSDIMVAHAHLKKEFREDEKYCNRCLYPIPTSGILYPEHVINRILSTLT